ncbi:chemotaxis protein CheY [Clostridium homopropionicum DSM 5847]|uniref:Stage 0 sporulation protein A homolog n=1 Tax=Clostridium homopropionicum DSM 5847 TaxID=1121318 RepID=A0A0L6ZF39_9CLOT|nr:response regulator [Clostridium homopropionicum]KOA21393.1 chemotaxis protein CheY [Clostridium homopropionicum DSM 5847]SFG11361.1 two-component system, chemotaxis family, response regulator CheY [Clostridium homopropionicum]
MNVLVVDDSNFIRLNIVNYLKNNNITVVGEASNGNEAIELYKKLRPDIVTMDITMPDMDGVEAVKKIMEIDSNAKIIICSAVGQQVKVIEAIKAGAKSFLLKPLNEEKMIIEINKVISF